MEHVVQALLRNNRYRAMVAEAEHARDDLLAPCRPSLGKAPALQLIGLRKAFGQTVAVDQIDLEVPRGTFLGLVGPNGAGKTTTLSMSVGLLRPDAGSALIFGHDMWVEPVAAKRLIGVVTDALSFPDRLTGREVLTFLGQLRGLDRRVVAERVDELVGVLGLDSAEAAMVVDYSTGMRKKLTLATALLHRPRLLVLDEPLEAVDPASAATVRTILRRFVAAGGSIILSSHVMAQVEQLCDQVAVISHGVLVATGSLADVCAGGSLEDAFMRLVGARQRGEEGLSWLAS